ncbi:MAG: hypothetical protein HY862_00545 [Chloroflexi bacterium]|nr:hypothetical protein [Chloroflexota bacterium]
MTTSPHPDMPDLQKAFDFTEEDLEANYHNWITERQKQKAVGHANDYFWLLGLGWGLVFVTIIVTIIYRLSAGWVLWCVIFALPITLVALVERYKIVYNLNHAILETIEGYSVLYYNKATAAGRPPSHPSARCFLEIQDSNGLRFSITIPQYEALRNGQLYRVFYLPTGSFILSIEPLF